MTKKSETLRKISVSAVLCALAYLCMFVFRFKVSFLTFDFKDAILSVVAFLYGPLYGIISSLVVSSAELFTVSDTGFYGFLMNFLSSAAFSSICGLFYKYRRTLSGAVWGAVFGVLCMTVVMLIANIFITPLYTGMPRVAIIKMIAPLLLPFNLIKGVVNAAITMILYKPITSAFKKTGLITNKKGETKKSRFLLLSIIAGVIIIVSIIVILYLMKGEFLFFSKK